MMGLSRSLFGQIYLYIKFSYLHNTLGLNIKGKTSKAVVERRADPTLKT